MTMNLGRRNLIILGFAAVVIAGLTTTIELWIYRSSGDIYLDRSRPGFLPDRDETDEKDEESSNYSFSDSGTLNEKEIDAYLKELEAAIRHLDNLKTPYSDSPLSDESLGIISQPAENPDETLAP